VKLRRMGRLEDLRCFFQSRYLGYISEHTLVDLALVPQCSRVGPAFVWDSARSLNAMGSRMQFGFCYIPDYHQSRHGDYRAWYERLLDEWELADSLGFDCVWIAEHRLAGYAFGSTPVIAQAIASRTRRIRIGTAVTLLPQRHPVLTAEDWAAVDLLSGGRLNFGIGRGIFAYDFAAVGVDSAESRARFEEAWTIIRRLWTEDGVTYGGKFWSFVGHTLRPKPLQKPTPPSFVGCIATPESYQWAGQNGMHLIVAPFLLKSTDEQREYLDLYRESLATAGHDPANFQVVANYHLAIVEREAELAGVEQYIDRYLKFLDWADVHQHAALDSKQYAAYASREAPSNRAQEVREHRAVVGTPQQCIDRIGELAEACGISGWMFHINYGGMPHERVRDQMHLFAERVIPAFASAGEPALAAAEPDWVGLGAGVEASAVAVAPSAEARISAASRERTLARSAERGNGDARSREQLAGAAARARGARMMTSQAVGYWRSCVLFAANKLEIFTAVGSRKVTAEQLASELQLDSRGTEKLLDACASLELLRREGDRFHLSDESRLYLDRASTLYLGDWMAHWADMLAKGNWQRLDEGVRTGRAVEPADSSFRFDPKRDPLHNWVLGMHEMGIAGHADLVAAAVPLDGATSLLDVGGGPGTYSIYLCQKYPDLQATIVDAPEVCMVARKLVREANLNDRIRFVHLDFRTQRLSRQFDVVLLSNVLHMCRKTGALAMLRNAADHLGDQGRLLIQEWILDDNVAGPELASLFDLHMLLNPDGDLYRLGELSEMIVQGGFDSLESVPTGGLYDLIVAQKCGIDRRPQAI
jgi:alkanesulfonate monooxygenase SsuD/methylene tetrahydromethanopterin reductase-like flavin-dependent oxidoreductase (luciferase family)/SAM-dependent methyltransferase